MANHKAGVIKIRTLTFIIGSRSLPLTDCLFLSLSRSLVLSTGVQYEA